MTDTLKIVVCLKRVPLLEGGIHIVDDRLSEDGLQFHLNEFDEYALEEALQLKEREGGEVTAVTLGPGPCREVLSTAMAKGADKGVHVLDEAKANRGPFATAERLASVIAKIRPSMVFTGVQSEDTGHSQVGVLIAGYLAYPHVSSVTDVKLEGSTKAIATREAGSGYTATVEVVLPCVFTIQTGGKQPRYASVLNVLRAKQRPVEVVRALDAENSADQELPLRRLYVPPRSRKLQMIGGSPKESAEKVVRLLAERGVL